MTGMKQSTVRQEKGKKGLREREEGTMVEERTLDGRIRSATSAHRCYVGGTWRR